MPTMSLGDYCEVAVAARPEIADTAAVVQAMARAIAAIAGRVALGPLGEPFDDPGTTNADGDLQKGIDVFCHEAIFEALLRAPVAELASEESDTIEVLTPGAPLAVAVDPLDGSANADINMPTGTIFSVVPAGRQDDPRLGSFAAPGSVQTAAGFSIYGPSTAFVVSMGAGVAIFTLDPRDRVFRLTADRVRIPTGRREFAINASNHRHWDHAVRTYIDDCTSGADGVRGADFNMRWIGALVADTFRILQRGGIYLYPSDRRPGYENGRLRLVYECRPVAFLVEQAGGRCTTGHERVLDLAATSLHARAPLIFGATDKVQRVERLHETTDVGADSAPLFARRGLFRV